MTRTKLFFLLLSMAVLLPSVAVAQGFRIFAAQKIVVADVIDRNDRPLDSGAKKMIRQSIVDACTASEGYEVFEVNMDDIKRQLKASGKQPTFLNICQMVKRKANAEYILFPEVRTSGTAVASTYGIKIYLDASLYRIDTESLVKSSRAEADTDESSIMAAIDRMVGELLGVKVNRQMPQQTYQPQQPTNQQPDKDKVSDICEEYPQFPGGMKALGVYLAENIAYPSEAAEKGIGGRVVVQFVVERDGSVSGAHVIRSVDPALDREAVRVVSNMPNWIPGKQNGTPVRCRYVVPIMFGLMKSEE